MNKIIFIAIIIFFTTMNAKAQSNDSVKSVEEIYSVVEQMPEFPGGEEARFQYMMRAVRYPAEAREKGIQGTVYIKFVVLTDGSIDDAKVLRGVGSGLDEVALNAIKGMPKWIPGKQNGKNVNVEVMIPVCFQLAE